MWLLCLPNLQLHSQFKVHPPNVCVFWWNEKSQVFAIRLRLTGNSQLLVHLGYQFGSKWVKEMTVLISCTACRNFLTEMLLHHVSELKSVSPIDATNGISLTDKKLRVKSVWRLWAYGYKRLFKYKNVNHNFFFVLNKLLRMIAATLINTRISPLNFKSLHHYWINLPFYMLTDL